MSDSPLHQSLPVQRHQLKRLSDAITAPSNHHASGPPGKVRKTAPARTGQACDRCKVRKIRCDARPGGCSPCLQNSTECKTTDRITGRTTSRGYTETVENENVGLRMYAAQLEAQLKQNGIELPPGPPIAQPPYQQSIYSSWDAPSANGNGVPATHTERHGSVGSHLPKFRQGCVGDNYLGVASESNWLSPIEGTSLTLFGTKIDLADFMPPEPNADAEAMSYQTFLAFTTGKRTASAPVLPDFSQTRQYAEWYFRSIQVFIPALHKPDFFRLLDRIYHEGHDATPAELVMVHMMLCIMYFQYSARNNSSDTRQMSFEHYHYCLTLVPDLMMNHKFEDIQALALICSQLRNQPRPGATWSFVRRVLALAIESGLHRSAKAWPNGSNTQLDAHMIEMRKRVFWTLMLFDINCSGNFGRPMPLRFEDFDIEMPEAVSDCLPEEEATLTPWKRCSFRAGLEGFKILRIMMRLYSTLYAVSPSPGPYEATVRDLARELQVFQEQLPPELQGGPQTTFEDRTSALFIQLSILECQLLLHHPATYRSSSPQMYNANLDTCLEASNKMMVVAARLKELQSLDTTLYYTTDFLAAICTTLFIHSERKSTLSHLDLARLRADMGTWLDVLGTVGQMLGTGMRLQQFMASIIDRHVTEINRHIAAQTASAAVASVAAAANSSPTSSLDQPTKHEHPPPEFYPTAPPNYAPYNPSGTTNPLATPTAAPQAQASPQVPIITTTPPFDPAAWRHFAESMMSGNPIPNGAGYSAAPSLMPLTEISMNGNAAFGGMAMPDSSRDWPMNTYANSGGHNGL